MMMSENNKYTIPCEMIRDLLPSYVDELTSEITNEKIDEHVSECAECKGILESMKNSYSVDGVNNIELGTEEKDTIDFLKKTKKKGIKAVVVGMIFVVLVMSLAILMKISVIGFDMKLEHDSWDIKVDGKYLAINCKPSDEKIKMKNFSIKDYNGVLLIDCNFVYDTFWANGTSEGFEFESYAEDYDSFKEIWVGDDLIWANGHYISSTALNTSDASHLYIGDAPANAVTANALKISRRYGSFTNELETSGERMLWRIIFDSKEGGRKFDTNQLEGIGFAMLATIDNLDEVEFVWNTSGADDKDEHFYTKKVTKENALNYTDKSVKEIGSDPASIAELLENYGIYN